MKKLFLFAVAICCTLSMMAEITEGDTLRYEHMGNNLFYQVTNIAEGHRAVKIIQESSTGYSSANMPKGALVIPDTVEAEGLRFAVKDFEMRALAGTSITSIQFPNTVDHTGDYICQRCYSLKKVVLSPSIITISQGSFMNSVLTDINLATSNVQTIGSAAFSNGIQMEPVTLPKTLKMIDSDTRLFFQCSSIAVDAENPYFKVIDGLLYKADTTMLVGVPRHSTETYTVQSKCTTLLYRALYESKSNLIFPQTEAVTIVQTTNSSTPFSFNDNFGSGTIYVSCGLSADYKAMKAWQNPSLNMSEKLMQTLTLQTDEEKGSVAQSAPANCNQITISATPKAGYKWYRWSDGNYDNPRVYTVEEDVTLSAEWITEGQFVIVATPNDAEYGSVTGSGVYDNGAEATLTATANTGYSFQKWSDGNTENPRTITVTEDVTLKAQFTIDVKVQITVAATPAYRGTVSGEGVYAKGKSVTLTATPNKGYIFERWNDDNTENPRTITADEDDEFTAFFGYKPAVKDDTIRYTHAGNTLYYKVFNATTAWVVPQHNVAPYYDALNQPTGELVVPDVVTDSAGTEFKVTIISSHAFDGCNALTSITMGANVTSLDEYSFANCATLKKVVLNDKITYLTNQLLLNTPIESINLDHITSIPTNTFSGHMAKIDTVAIPAGLTTVGFTYIFDGCRAITLHPANTNFALVNGILYNADTTMIMGIPSLAEDTLVVDEKCHKMFANLLYTQKVSLKMPKSGIVNIYASSAKDAVPYTFAQSRGASATGQFIALCEHQAAYEAADAWKGLFSAFVYGEYYTLTLGEAENGSAEAVRKTGECETYTLTATPASGYKFSRWSDESIENPREVVLTEDATLTAVFEVDTPSDITNVNNSDATIKRIVNGQLLILRDGKTYNALGAEL